MTVPRLSLICVCLLAAGLEGQTRPTPAVPTPGDVARLAREDGVLWAVGGAYKASFTPDGVTFVPALGRRTSSALPVHFRLEAYGRGTARINVAGLEPEAETEGRVVRYRRTGIEERYEVRAGGLEQSFVFATLPPGEGDLVVRLRVTSELAASAAAGGGARLTRSEVGGVEIGSVTGVDAAQDRAAGSMRLEAGVLELRLPAGFVDRAALPLVLDPLISTFTLGTGGDERTPDVAYEATYDRFLVVWERWYSASDADVLAQRFTPAGAPVGQVVLVRTGTTHSQAPRVACVEARDAFVVVWYEAGFLFPQVLARTVHAGTGVQSDPPLVVSSLGAGPDIGGDSSSASDEAVVVFATLVSGNPALRATRVQVSPSGAPNLPANGTATFGGSTDDVASISKTGGAARRHLVTWQSTVNGERYVRAQAFDRGMPHGSNVAVAIVSGGREARYPVVDGDGTQWLVAFGREEAAGGEVFDLVGRRLVFDPGNNGLTLATGEIPIDAAAGHDERPTGVAWLGNSIVVGYVKKTYPLSSTSMRVRSIDPISCRTCEGDSRLWSSSGNHSGHVRLAARPGATPEAMIVRHEIVAGDGNVVGHRFRADAGRATDLAGGCGGGSCLATCAVVGNADFTVRVQGAAAAAVSLLVLAPARASLVCGPCTLVPDPSTALVLGPVTTSSQGAASLGLAIPNSSGLRGARIYLQWVVAGGGCLGFALSNGLEVQIQ